MEKNSKMVKLWDIPRDKGIKIYAEMISDGSEYMVFHHIDGMYSLCTTQRGAFTHLSASTPLVPYKDGYEIAHDNNNKQG
jgi:hypothetical protein